MFTFYLLRLDCSYSVSIFLVKSADQSCTQSTLSTPSTISPAPDSNPEEDYSKASTLSHDYDKLDATRTNEYLR